MSPLRISLFVTYAVIAIVLFWASHATNPTMEPIPTGIFVIAFGLWQLFDFQRGRVFTGAGSVDRAKQPEQFWLLHLVYQAVVLFALCLPWIEELGA